MRHECSRYVAGTGCTGRMARGPAEIRAAARRTAGPMHGGGEPGLTAPARKSRSDLRRASPTAVFLQDAHDLSYTTTWGQAQASNSQ